MSGSVHGDSNIAINTSLERIFGENAIYCIDNRDMTFNYIVYDESIQDLAIELYARDLLPRPVGIDIRRVFIGDVKQFGFGNKRLNFNRGNFYAGVLAGN